MRRKRSRHDERFLRYIWSQQYFRTENLLTTDNRRLVIEHVGAWNRESGPDFLDAIVRIDGIVYRGDIEIHKNLIAWKQHNHHTDARYNRVILHVVLRGHPERSPTIAASGRSVPILLLEPYLTESIDILWSKASSEVSSLGKNHIPCHGRWKEVEVAVLRQWLDRLSTERMEMKLRRFEERLRQLAEERIQGVHEPWRLYASAIEEDLPSQIPPSARELTLRDLSRRELWDQLMYEGLMECLGYSHNRQQFLRLSRIVTLQIARSILHGDQREAIEAVLFGVSGLLPANETLDDPHSRQYVAQLRKQWIRWKGFVRGDHMHQSEWQFFPTRPSNFPTVRIAAAASLVEACITGDLFRRIIQQLKSQIPVPKKRRVVSDSLRSEPSEFWTHHYRFDERSSRRITPLGQSRIDEMIANTLLPCALLYARVFRDRILRDELLQMYATLGPLPENSVTRIVQSEIGDMNLRLETLRLHQGAIQLYRYYCSVGRCRECAIGRIVFRVADESTDMRQR